ncbi:ADP-ribosylation factor-like protein 9 [Gadus morhua]|uniref:ADP-ribosylation factor-like protein 9 n=1 Tax=Gadus morhua TaxID=8049 RepID=UPI0011B680D4|nr:ADP-ribosylation factor-like protein 9 [Gadus morhua]
MSGFREAVFVGTSIALTGGLGYVIWTYLSSGYKQPRQKEDPGLQTSKLETVDSIAKTELSTVTAEAGQAQKASVAESKPGQKASNQVLVLGLDGSGKTSLLHCFSTGGLEQDVVPTEGFNAVSINREDLQIEFLEIGGKENLRPYWQKYLGRAAVLVFVVDSSRADLFPTAKTHLHELVARDPLLPLVVLANKQDLAGACSITDLHEALELSRVGDQRKMFLIGTYVQKGEAELNSGAEDARDLIFQMVCGV